VEHERQPLGRGQGVQDHQQGQPHPLGLEGLLLGIVPVGLDRVGQVLAHRLLLARGAGLEHVQAHPTAPV
jgi:hypothetical protein